MQITYPGNIDATRLDNAVVKHIPVGVTLGLPAVEYVSDFSDDIASYTFAHPALTEADKSRLDWAILVAPADDPVFTQSDVGDEAMDALRARIDAELA